MKEFGIFSFWSVEEVRNIVFSRGVVVILVVVVVEFFWIGIFCGIVVVVFMELGLFGIKLVEFGRRNILGVLVIDLGVIKLGNGELF